MRIERFKLVAIIKKIILYILIVILSFFILYNLIYVASKALNIDTNVKTKNISLVIIKDDTMEPEINKNDLVVARKVAAQKIEIGDIIIWNNKAYRVTYIDSANNYTIKGDKNLNNNYDKIKYEEIQGKYDKTIKVIGKILVFFQSKTITVFIIIAMILILRYYKNSVKTHKRRLIKKIKENKKYE